MIARWLIVGLAFWLVLLLVVAGIRLAIEVWRNLP